MLTLPTPRSPLSPRAEHGISMIEVLVAMIAATVVTAAVVTVLQVAYNQQTLTTDHTQANQMGRTAMNSIVTELNSSCTGVAPIQYVPETEVTTLGLKAAGPLSLWLISVYGTENTEKAVLKKAVKQDIQWSETGTSNTGEKLGTLTDYEFASSSEGESPSQWKFPLEKTNMKKRLLAENVIPFEVNKAKTVFQYYEYHEGVLTQASSVSKENAEKISKVSIDFKQAPADGDTRQGRVVSLADAVNLRLDPSESTSEGPCE